MRKTKPRYLQLLLKEEIIEGRPDYTLFSRREKTALEDVLAAIEQAARDRKIAAMELTLDNLVIGWGRLSALRRSLLQFRRSGKPIYCFMESGGNAEYFLASACDQIFIPPASSLHLVGLKAEVFFFRDVLDRFGIEPNLRSVGEYKSAGETFTRNEMSPQSREQWNVLLDDLFEEFCRLLGEGRGLPREEIIAKINQGPYTAREAYEQRLVDGLCYEDEIKAKLEEKFGSSLRAIPANRYSVGEGFIRRLVTFRRPRVALLHIIGNLSSGESRRGADGRAISGSDTIGGFLDHANKSRRIRAVVLRIDSPGGTGIASDVIWRKVSLLQKKKPVVASFGDVAASGAYYIAAAASSIVAEPTSITGSIGVMGGKFVAKKLIERLGVHHASLRRGDHAEYGSPLSSFSEGESDRLARQLEEFYRQDFLKKVADGRRMSDDAADQVGRGRIWSGARARDNGLVDITAGLKEAIEEARQQAGIPAAQKTRLVHYHRRRRPRELIAPDITAGLRFSAVPHPGVELLGALEWIGKAAVLLWMPFRIRIH
jgi:protease IV